MIDWAQAFYMLAGTCAALIAARFLWVERRVDRHEELCNKLSSAITLMESLVEKHESRFDNIDLAIHHLRESDHDIRNHLPSLFEKQEIDRRRAETAENFKRLFVMLDDMKTERFLFQQKIMEMLASKQDKVH